MATPDQVKKTTEKIKQTARQAGEYLIPETIGNAVLAVLANGQPLSLDSLLALLDQRRGGTDRTLAALSELAAQRLRSGPP